MNDGLSAAVDKRLKYGTWLWFKHRLQSTIRVLDVLYKNTEKTMSNESRKDIGVVVISRKIDEAI